MIARTIILLCALTIIPLTAKGGELLDVQGAVRRALTSNPDIIAAQADVAAAQARERQASLLFQDNPAFEAAAGPRNDGTNMDYSVEVGQKVEIGGQRSARIDAATADLESRRARLAWRRVEVAAAVRRAFGRVLAAERLVEVARQSAITGAQALEAAEKRFRAGDISRLEINTARVERGRTAQERGRAEQEVAIAVAELQRLLALPPEEALVVRGNLSAAHTEPEELSALIGKALESRSDLQAARFDLLSARAASHLASREWLPRPRLGVSFAHEEGAEIVQGVVGIDLPAFNRNQGGRGTASARVVQAEQSLQAARRRAEQEIRLAHRRLRAAEETASAFATEVVNAMQENLDLGNRAFQAGEIDFTQLLLIRRESLEAQRAYVGALEELNAASVDLNRTLGRE
jgi:cobalt-zinc-cadmium efflux system outer membrane protein